jgi:cold shock CspA family protein
MEHAQGEGYGIILAETGEQVFFVDSAVTGIRFFELAKGQRVLFALDDGPLTRAKSVQPVANGEKENAAPTSETWC